MIKIDLQFPDLHKMLIEYEQEINVFIAAIMQTNRGMVFDSEGKHNGRPGWAPLKFRNGQILSKSGTLRKSIAPMSANGKAGQNGIVRISGDTITIGTSLYYARMMNNGTAGLPGGVLRPKEKKALKIPVGNGKFIFRKVVRIPARNFDDWTQDDQAEMEESLSNKIEQILNKGIREGGKYV